MYAVSIPEKSRNRYLRQLDRKLDRTGGSDSCWPWRGKLYDGYGQIIVNHRKHNASRVIYALMVGDVPADQHVLHVCDNRACGNHAHMFLGTNQDNVDDREEKGRGAATAHSGPLVEYWKQRGENPIVHLWSSPGGSPRSGDDNPMRYMPECRPRGEHNGGAKLTADQVILIRELAASGETQDSLASRFKVSRVCISKVVRRITWTHI